VLILSTKTVFKRGLYYICHSIMMAVTDEYLAKTIRQGNKESLSLLYDKYAPCLLGLISKIVQDADLAEEALKQTFVSIWKQIGEYEPSGTTFFLWIITISRKAAHDMIQSEEYKRNSKIQKVNHSVYSEDMAKPKESAFSLHPDERTALDLVLFRGLTLDEGADELKIPVEAIRTNLRTAIKNLKAVTAE
jgi:RNA polymerase sigma factor (sigma-70 family)